MITKKIFLASSSELNTDRVEFQLFIARKNNEWVRKDILLQVIVWEDFLEAMSQTRLQDEYNKAILESDIFVMLFSTKVGQYTEEEFETAFEHFKTTNCPLIFTYFKDVEIRVSHISEHDFMSLRAFQKSWISLDISTQFTIILKISNSNSISNLRSCWQPELLLIKLVIACN